MLILLISIVFDQSTMLGDITPVVEGGRFGGLSYRTGRFADVRGVLRIEPDVLRAFWGFYV